MRFAADLPERIQALLDARPSTLGGASSAQRKEIEAIEADLSLLKYFYFGREAYQTKPRKRGPRGGPRDPDGDRELLRLYANAVGVGSLKMGSVTRKFCQSALDLGYFYGNTKTIENRLRALLAKCPFEPSSRSPILREKPNNLEDAARRLTFLFASMG